MNEETSRYFNTHINISTAPTHWKESCTNTECSLHQLAPYTGKIKSTIAAELIERYSEPGDLVVDPFAGCGTIPFEAVIRKRQIFGADISPYACILSKAKFSPPSSLNLALELAEQALEEASMLPEVDLREVPLWVRKFFHPKTLKETINFAKVCRQPGREFLMACFLGILHHQRPGFLSYPSSHLVPYLRDRKYPRDKFPEMYTYRELRPRLLAKIKRSYKRFIMPQLSLVKGFEKSSVQQLTLPQYIDALITSPPYMNALDYGRDNRLRLWFIDPCLLNTVDNDVTKRKKSFIDAITSLAVNIEKRLIPKGFCVFIIGEEVKRSVKSHPSEIVFNIMNKYAQSLHPVLFLVDNIPDIRRSRRQNKCVKTEHILVFQRK